MNVSMYSPRGSSESQFDTVSNPEEDFDHMYNVVYGTSTIGQIYFSGKTPPERVIVKVAGDVVKTLAVYIAIHVYIWGALPDISVDVEMISEVSL